MTLEANLGLVINEFPYRVGKVTDTIDIVDSS